MISTKIKSEIPRAKQLKKINEATQGRSYLIHHIHHFKKGSRGARHEVHHCLLFGKKSMKGKKYIVSHRVFGNKLYHCLTEKFEGELFDHTSGVLKIIRKKINDKEIYEIS